MATAADWRGLRIDMGRLGADIEALSVIGRAADGALTRHAFSPAYEAARAWLKDRMATAGMVPRDDAAGNCLGRMGPAAGPCVMAGSHIDTVPDGGPLDGALGVLAAIEVGRVMDAAGLVLPRAFEVAAFADEEGRYLDCLGSKAMAGRLAEAEVAAAADPAGQSLAAAMRAAGFEPARLAEAARPAGDIAAYVELHIEQGPVLEDRGLAIGVVQAIVGIDHTDVTFRGEPDHAGTTPMDLRKDAFTGAAEFATRARRLVLAEGTPGRARLTYGVVELEPGAANIVPHRVRMRQEIREVSDDALARLVTSAGDIARGVAAAHRLGVDYTSVSASRAAAMDDGIQALIREAADGLGLGHMSLASGAGHDAQVIAAVAPAGMIFVPSRGGRSHRRDEWTDPHHLEAGANVLLQTVLRLLYR